MSDCSTNANGPYDVVHLRIEFEGGKIPWMYPLALNGRVMKGGYVDGDLFAPVVRCRDCQHFTPKGTYKFSNGKVNDDFCYYVRGWRLQITPDGYCAWGERKEGGDD